MIYSQVMPKVIINILSNKFKEPFEQNLNTNLLDQQNSTMHYIKKDIETDLMCEINECLNKYKYSDIPKDRKDHYDKIA